MKLVVRACDRLAICMDTLGYLFDITILQRVTYIAKFEMVIT